MADSRSCPWRTIAIGEQLFIASDDVAEWIEGHAEVFAERDDIAAKGIVRMANYLRCDSLMRFTIAVERGKVLEA